MDPWRFGMDTEMFGLALVLCVSRGEEVTKEL